jgi:hypothetical protein
MDVVLQSRDKKGIYLHLYLTSVPLSMEFSPQRCYPYKVNDQNETQKESKRFMMYTKRVILADGSRLLREMLHRVINKADHLEVVQEVANLEDLPAAIERFDPEWVIISLPVPNPVRTEINACVEAFPSVRFLFLSPDSNRIKLKWQAVVEEDLTNLTLKDFLGILAKDLQHI